MRKLSLLMLVSVMACNANPNTSNTLYVPAHLPTVQHQPIVGGTIDQGDPGVIELFYLQSFAPSACTSSQCTANCYSTTTGQACTSGTGCVCGGGATCSSELIGPHTLMTAGHCTDTTAGGELSGPGGPTMVLCTSINDINGVLSGQPPADCNMAVFAIFNNTCTTNDAQSDCEFGLLFGADGGGAAAGGYNFIFVDQLVNPGYSPSTLPPDDDNDLGLAHLTATTLESGACEPPLMTFNRTSLGSDCTSLGTVKFVGYGITSGSGQTSGIKYYVNHTAAVLDTYHDYEGNPQVIGVSTQCSSLGSGEPTCSGDSGGPTLDANGVILAVTSLGDQSCSAYGQDSRVDAHASWIDTTMSAPAWGDYPNGSDGGPSQCNSACNSCVSAAQSGTGACVADLNACVGDTACTNVLGCTNNCGDTQECTTDCESDAGATATAQFNAINTCINTTCATACGEPATTTASSSSSGSTTGPTAVASSSGAGSTGAASSGAVTTSTSTAASTAAAAGSSGNAASTTAAAGSTGTGAGSTGAAAGSTGGAGGVTTGLGTLGGSTGSTSSAAKSGGCGAAGGGESLAALLPFVFLGLTRRRRF